MSDIKKYTRDGQVAVLYSPGFGAGWSTWNRGEAAKRCLYEPTIVQWVLDGKPKDRTPDIKELFGDEYFCTLGMRSLEIEWVTPGQPFRVDEYDGYESIEYMDKVDWEIA